MILTGEQIKKEITKGNIVIDKFCEESIQPNSYDFHLGAELIHYSSGVLNDTDNPANSEKVRIREDGYLLKPNDFYLGITEEVTASKKFTQLLYGDNSIGSLGVWVQISAPMAHVGSKIRWTLEISCVRPVKIYSGMKFGKICFLVNEGKIIPYGHESFLDSGRYLNNEISPSLINKKIKKEDNYANIDGN